MEEHVEANQKCTGAGEGADDGRAGAGAGALLGLRAYKQKVIEELRPSTRPQKVIEELKASAHQQE
eukprot:1136934-Pelagomonas_calceolata.AAC.6